MAFTPAEKVDIRLYAGWSGRWAQTDSALENAITAVEGEADTETKVRALITSCLDIETKLVDAHGRLKAVKVGEITLPMREEIETLRDEGRRFSGKLCSTLGVEYRHDVWGSGGPRYQQTYAGRTGGGNYALQG